MNTIPASSASGTPVAPDSESIERELAALWSSSADSDESATVVRACSCNVVVIAGDSREAGLMPSLLAEISEWHPCRSLIAFREADGVAHESRPGLRAWISAQCSLPFAGGPQICCEAITVAASGNAAGNLPNTLVSLMVPDLSVFVYWRSFRNSELELVERLAPFADLLIVDSRASKDEYQGRERLFRFLTHSPGGVAVRDLNWSRLTAWRDLIAQFFDTPSTHHLAWEIAEMQIHRAVASPGAVPTRTLLLTGWLATRLGWKWLSSERKGDEWVSRWKGRSGEVVVRFTGETSGSGQEPGISSVLLETRNHCRFEVLHSRASACMTARSEADGTHVLHSVPQEAGDEAMLLVRELSIAGEDNAFSIALAEAVALENSFR